MAGKYAAETTVTVRQTKAEIEAVLQRYGADQFYSGWDEERAVIGFRIDGRQVKVILPVPDRKSRDITHTETGKERYPSAQNAAYDQALRQSWRALLLVIKAKLEATASGISTIEREFLADIVMPDGRTVGEWAKPQIQAMYESGNMPALLPGTQRSIEA